MGYVCTEQYQTACILDNWSKREPGCWRFCLEFFMNAIEKKNKQQQTHNRQLREWFKSERVSGENVSGKVLFHCSVMEPPKKNGTIHGNQM